MEQPEAPILASLNPPPAGLRVKEGLDRVEVTLPPYLRGRAVIAGALAAAGMVAYRVEWPIGTYVEDHIVTVALCTTAALLGLWAWRPLLAKLSRVSAGCLTVLWMFGMVATCASIVPFGDLYPSLLCMGPPVVATILTQVAWEAPRLVLDSVKLEIYDRGRRRYSVPLEAIRSLDREVWFGRVRINGEGIPALSRMPWPEWAWIEGLLKAQIAQRRAALTRQGHDLAVPPAGLAEVQATCERPER